MIQIIRWGNENVIHEFEGTIKEAVEDAVKKGISLQYANLRNANLRDADLAYANLRNADLRNAGLAYANLRNADLRNARLRCADLYAANITNANFENANLENTDFRCTQFYDANFLNTNIKNSTLQRVNIEKSNFQHNFQNTSDLSFKTEPTASPCPLIDVVDLLDCNTTIEINEKLLNSQVRINDVMRQVILNYITAKNLFVTCISNAE